MPAPAKKKRQRTARPAISVRLSGHIRLEPQADGTILGRFEDHSISFGQFSAAAAKRALELRTGLPLDSFATGGRTIDKEIDLLVRRLARSGLVEYRLGDPRGKNDQVVIEPQLPDYWPQIAKLGAAETVVLSRFAYLRRRGNEMVLESPRAGALFRIGDPRIAATLATLATPQKISRLRRQDGFPGIELLGLLADCRILFKLDAARSDGLRLAEGDDSLVLWDFHDLLFHTHSTERPASQSARRALSLCGPDPAATGGAAALAGKEDRSARTFGRVLGDCLAVRQASARASLDTGFRRSAADHACRACAFSRHHGADPLEMEKPGRPRRRRSHG